MTHNLSIAPELSLDLEDVYDQKTSVLAKSGAGKSYLAGVIVEEILATDSVPVFAIDPTGGWWGLRAGAGGKEGGYPVLILGGAHGDAPLDPDVGVSVAKFLCEQRVSTILDVSHMAPDDSRRFVADFLSALYAQQLKVKQPVYLVVDEADEFAPESGSKSGGYIGQSLRSMQTIVRRGRQAGIGVMLITQRSASISKDVLSQTDILFALQTNSPHDLAAIKSWIEKAADAATVKKAMDAIPKMKAKTGQAIFYSPSSDAGLKRIHVRKKRTFDSSATPKLGEKAPAAKLSEIDIPTFTGNLQKTIEKARAEDPKRLLAEIRELNRQLEEAKAAHPEPVVQQMSQDEFDDMVAHAQVGRDAQWFDWIAETVDLTMGQAADRLRAIADERRSPFQPTSSRIGEELPAAVLRPRPILDRETEERLIREEAVADLRQQEAMQPRHETNGHTTERLVMRSLTAQQRIIAVLKQMPQGATASKLAGRAGVPRKRKSTYRNTMTALRHAGLVQSEGDVVKLTPAGLKAAKDIPSLPPPGPQLQKFWESELGGVPLDIYRYLGKAGTQWVPRAQLMKDLKIDPKTSTFRNSLTRLTLFDLVERQKSAYRLNQELVVG